MTHLLLLAAASLHAQQIIGTSTVQEVMLDLVVRDSKGRLIQNLGPEELTVFDNGVPQSLRAFEFVQTSTRHSRESRALEGPLQSIQPASAKTSTWGEPRLVTIVFDQLRPEQRPIARTAAREALKMEGPNLYFAVFAIDQRLTILSPYTTDRARVERAIDRASGPLFSLNTDESQRIGREQEAASLAETLEGMKGQGDPSMPPSTLQRMVQMTLNMVQFADNGDRSQQGRAQFFSLWSLVKEQKRLPGRKTLIYLTGGMSVPPEYDGSFQLMISDANRANVSIYAIDVSGLNTYNANTSGVAILRQAASSSRTNMMDRTGVISTDQAQALDRAEISTTSNVQNSLEVMSRATGGFMAANTNDFRPALRRIAEETTTHYELSYAPKIDVYDGRERRIQVKISRPGATVQTRSGYFALPFDMQPYETSMLAALSAADLPVPFQFRAAAKQFPGDPARTIVVVDVPIRNITLARDEAAGSFRMHLSVLHLFKDSTGAIVQKIARDVPGKGELQNLEATRAGRFIHSDHVALPPGEYTLESAVFDQESHSISGLRQQVTISGTATGMSDLTLIRSISAVSETTDLHNPLEFPGHKVTPHLDTLAHPGGKFDVYFVTRVAGQARLALMKDGQLVSSGVAIREPVQCQDGHMHYVASLPIPASSKSGLYQIIAGDASGTRTLAVTVE